MMREWVACLFRFTNPPFKHASSAQRQGVTTLFHPLPCGHAAKSLGHRNDVKRDAVVPAKPDQRIANQHNCLNTIGCSHCHNTHLNNCKCMTARCRSYNRCSGRVRFQQETPTCKRLKIQHLRFAPWPDNRGEMLGEYQTNFCLV